MMYLFYIEPENLMEKCEQLTCVNSVLSLVARHLPLCCIMNLQLQCKLDVVVQLTTMTRMKKQYKLTDWRAHVKIG